MNLLLVVEIWFVNFTDNLPTFLIINKLSWTASNMTRFACDYSCFDQDKCLADDQSIQSDNVSK